MTLREALETTKIHSVAGKLKEVGLMNQRPFRSLITRYQMLRLLVGKLWVKSMAHNMVCFWMNYQNLNEMCLK
jgi:magnesium chelatase family protein